MRAFLAGTLALVTFFTLTGILNERASAGMSWSEVATSRLIGALLMVLTARPYGLWLDLVRRWFGLPPRGAEADVTGRRAGRSRAGGPGGPPAPRRDPFRISPRVGHGRALQRGASGGDI